MSNNSKSQKLKLVTIIGGTGGVGSVAAELFLEQGYRLAVLYHRDHDRAQAIIGKSPEKAMAYQCDVTDEISVQNAFKEIESKQGITDVVVFAPSAPITPKPLFYLSWENFSNHLDIQAKGLFLIFKSLSGAIMAGHKIKFIILSTELCLGTPPSSLADYVTAKYALLGLSKCLAVELARFNSALNIISPGPINTKLLKNLSMLSAKGNGSKNPLRKIAEPEDIAQVILFLAGDEAEYLNGANINVNGGGVMF